MNMGSTLTAIYSQIAVMELLESVNRCGTVWSSYDYNTYTTTVQMNQGIYSFYLSSHPETNNYILDVSKNGTYYTSISSNDQSTVSDLYYAIVSQMNFNKQKSLVNNLSQLARCPQSESIPPIEVRGGLLLGGGKALTPTIYTMLTTGRGLKINGYAAKTNNIVLFASGASIGNAGGTASAIIKVKYNLTDIAPDGPLAGGQIEINTFNIIADTDGPLAGGTTDTSHVFDVTTNTDGPLAGGTAA